MRFFGSGKSDPVLKKDKFGNQVRSMFISKNPVMASLVSTSTREAIVVIFRSGCCPFGADVCCSRGYCCSYSSNVCCGSQACCPPNSVCCDIYNTCCPANSYCYSSTQCVCNSGYKPCGQTSMLANYYVTSSKIFLFLACCRCSGRDCNSSPSMHAASFGSAIIAFVILCAYQKYASH